MEDKRIQELINKQLGTGYGLTPTAEHIGFITDRNGTRYRAYNKVEVCDITPIKAKPRNNNVIQVEQSNRLITVLKNGQALITVDKLKDLHSTLYALTKAPTVPKLLEWECEYITTKAINILALLESMGTILNVDLWELKKRNQEYAREKENEQTANAIAQLCLQCKITQAEIAHIDELLDFALLEFWGIDKGTTLLDKLTAYAQLKTYESIPELIEEQHKYFEHITLVSGRPNPKKEPDNYIIPLSACDEDAEDSSYLTQWIYDRICGY